jgi:hypothetical protein
MRLVSGCRTRLTCGSTPWPARGCALILAALAWCLAGAAAAAAAPTLSVVGPGQQALKIELDHGEGGRLLGRGHLILRNDSETAGVVHLEYVPQHGAEPSDLKVASTTLPAHALAAVEVDAELPPGSDPADLGGLASLRLESNGRTVGKPLDVTIEGVGPSFADVTIVPSTLALHNVNWAGPLGHAKSASISVELTGAGVPGLFRGGAKQFTSHTLLRSSTGRELEATLTAAAPSGTDTIARGEVTVTGSLAPGSYTGTLALSSLAAAGAPSIAITTESSDAFIWAMLILGLGALAGGGVYLASGLKRRKDLMQAYLKTALEAYKAKKCAAWLWSLDGLGKEDLWFKGTWTALPETAGVQGVWSQIHWARNKEDLEAIQPRLDEIIARVTRWLQVADDPALSRLQAAFELEPQDPIEGSGWQSTHTYSDTRLLRLTLEEREPADAGEVKALIERVARQARWHALLASVWDLKSKIATHVADENAAAEKKYREEDRNALGEIDLRAIDTQASPETKREPDAQLQLENQLEGFRQRLLNLYRGAEPIPSLQEPDALGELGALSPDQLADRKLAPAVAPAVHDAAREMVVAREAQGDAVQRGTPPWLVTLTWLDVIWSAVIVIVALAVYVPVFYGPTWGNLGDYATAFIAGFVGKVAVNWGALPAFRSISMRAKAPEVKEAAPGAANASDEVLKGLAALIGGVPHAAPAPDGAGVAGAPPGAAGGGNV